MHIAVNCVRMHLRRQRLMQFVPFSQMETAEAGCTGYLVHPFRNEAEKPRFSWLWPITFPCRKCDSKGKNCEEFDFDDKEAKSCNFY